MERREKFKRVCAWFSIFLLIFASAWAGRLYERWAADWFSNGEFVDEIHSEDYRYSVRVYSVFFRFASDGVRYILIDNKRGKPIKLMSANGAEHVTMYWVDKYSLYLEARSRKDDKQTESMVIDVSEMKQK